MGANNKKNFPFCNLIISTSDQLPKLLAHKQS